MLGYALFVNVSYNIIGYFLAFNNQLNYDIINAIICSYIVCYRVSTGETVRCIRCEKALILYMMV